MSTHANHLGQPIGFPVSDWQPRPRPPRSAIDGRFCRLEPFDAERHAADLFAAYSEDAQGRIWTYLPNGPFASFELFRKLMQGHFSGEDPLCHVILDRASGRAAGMASYMRIDPAAGSIEVGSIAYAPRLQRSRAATETMYLLMRRVFDELKYRRYEWKCDALNAPSRAAALRLGFRFEGIFRQAIVYKGRNRDTAWYSIIDREWPALKQVFERWLDASNFDAEGRQRESLSVLTRAALELATGAAAE
jgi:RimJ/RimL family protein N-acetyltransferase